MSLYFVVGVKPPKFQPVSFLLTFHWPDLGHVSEKMSILEGHTYTHFKPGHLDLTYLETTPIPKSLSWVFGSSLPTLPQLPVGTVESPTTLCCQIILLHNEMCDLLTIQ